MARCAQPAAGRTAEQRQAFVVVAGPSVRDDGEIARLGALLALRVAAEVPRGVIRPEHHQQRNGIDAELRAEVFRRDLEDAEPPHAQRAREVRSLADEHHVLRDVGRALGRHQVLDDAPRAQALAVQDVHHHPAAGVVGGAQPREQRGVLGGRKLDQVTCQERCGDGSHEDEPCSQCDVHEPLSARTGQDSSDWRLR